MMMRTGYKTYLLVIALIHSLYAFPQADQYYQGNFVRNDNNTYNPAIQTVLLYKSGFELAPPIIQLNTDEKLILSFDELDAAYKNYRYTIIQCDAFWNTSQLQQIEYLEGFQEDYINDYQYSYNTTTKYVNYMLVFPTDYLKIKKSGNYIIKVYLDSPDDQNVVLTHRFMVYEPLVNVPVKVEKAMDLSRRDTYQQISFTILAGNYYITDAYRDLHVFVMQNGRWDNMIENINPRMITGNVYEYSMIRDLAFPGCREFRYFDMKTLKYNTDRMTSIEYLNNGYNVFLMTDQPRLKSSCLSEEDINGRRLISVNQARDPNSEADYAWVHFLLPLQAPPADGSLYVAGEFADWQYRPFNKMTYNFSLHAFEASILLKQGYYNYAYAFLENGSNTGDLTYIDGSCWETENEYTVLVYHRQQGDLYDRLIGIGFVNSGQ